MLPLTEQSVTQAHIHQVMSGSQFYGSGNQLPHDNITAPGASNPLPFGYESAKL